MNPLLHVAKFSEQHLGVSTKSYHSRAGPKNRPSHIVCTTIVARTWGGWCQS